MRAILYVGTRTCPQAITEAMRQHHDPVTILVAADAKLLGQQRDHPDLAEGLRPLAGILEDKARQQAIANAQANQRELTDVFGDASKRPNDRITTRIITEGVDRSLLTLVEDQALEDLFAGRDALDILQAASIDVQAILPEDVALHVV